MARNLLVINVDLRETRVALIENGVIAELQIERSAHRGIVGNIILGKVTRVLPGMQAAFIDIGQERAAFLHVEDLIRPDDFEAYLTGGASRSADEEGDDRIRGEQKRRADYVNAPTTSEQPEEDDEDVPIVAAGAESANGDDEVSVVENAAPAAEPPSDEDSEEEDAEADEAEEDDEDAEAADDDDDSDPEAAAAEPVNPGDPEAPPTEPVADTSAAAEVALAIVEGVKPETDRQLREANGGGRRRRRRRRGRGGEQTGKSEPQAKQKQAGGNRGREDRGGRRKDARISRSVPITEVVKEGDEVVVQVSKEPIGTKGARVTSHVSLPGRHVVYLPTVEHIGVSKRIGSARERQRLREVIDAIKPPKGGLIVRTVAEGLTKKGLKTDIGYLVKVWEEVSKKHETAKSPAVLYTELDLVLKVARDLFTDEIEKIVIDDKEQYGRLVRFIEAFMPERAGQIELYSGDEPIFDAYGIEDEIGRALSRKVPLPSGGYLIIDQAEALTAIDVNTGRFVGKGSRDLEETAMKTNLEAVEEIAYQLRFRNIGGLVILDLIDMERAGNREQVYRALDQRLAKDKAKTTLNRISELGLVEMTRKRTRESLGRVLHEPCFYCDGTGQIQSRATIAYEILRQIRRDRANLPGYQVVVNAHPAVIDFMQTEERAAVEEAGRRFQRRIMLTPRSEYHIEQFDLQGK
ncbi:MAG TPA: Rne/Rng family ribonuclease [Polyangiaceae bacterium]|nr:Rne/Rng family ribonuclease [Polyangiaceae bacterium]